MRTSLEPDPVVWLTSTRISDLHATFDSSRLILAKSGLLRAALGYWVRHEASCEAIWDSSEEENELQRLTKDWKSNNPQETSLYSDSTLRDKLRVAPASIIWSRQRWGHLLESSYLQNKDSLDSASCGLIRHSDKNFLNELYHRINSSEVSFEVAASKYGQGPERLTNGLLPLKPISDLPHGLGPLIKKLSPGQLTVPLGLGKKYCLVILHKYKPSRLDQQTEKVLLSRFLKEWIDCTVDQALLELMG